ncbi:acyl-CoA synthetase [Mycolicibacterium brumae]|uniref:Acyl-CoA synthetase n=1 Tax=Mycolicibacterium brumae TaxID=85968 RepID=A0A2G5PHH0_9MYCO|nr:acyl-CoA synthetase [Mycolicibacterium brumae]MCV7192531.1 acyl-CoA synthetase [Mycolicibacterium brumae]PIB77473.1 acyl-CoA synthetase [Mycolicibacterium brumae]RWA18477.1 hypothetical protein MBRU_04475 [Mycolicibacterium brumae DSM 44177]UWW10300.1 acyl-CoA synthetase [Mycolicibacterium brumae]
MHPGVFAALTPDKPAVVMSDTGETLTYAALEERSVRLANALRDAGLGRGDVLAVLAENLLETYVFYWAAMRSGLYLTAINHHLTGPEVAYIVNDAQVGALIASAGFADTATAVAAECPAVRLRLAVGGPIPGYDDYDAALSAASPTPPQDQPRGTDFLYSSGTTGRPKGVKPALPEASIDTHVNMLRMLFGAAYGFDADTVYLSPAPLYHAAPLRFGGMIHEVGATVVVMPRFDAAQALTAIEKYRVTHSQWVPTMFVRMLKLADEQRRSHDLSSHRIAIHAAAPCPAEVKHAMIDWWGPILCEYYSSTEAIGVTMIDSAEWLAKPGSVGRSVLGAIHICDDDGRELPVGESGVVYFEREVFPFAYHNNPEKTRGAQHPEHPNWGTTGDIGYLDDDGALYLVDRKDFMIISGGVNIYPQEIEDALALHPDVHDVAVFGVPHPEMGEQVKAVVQAAPGSRPEASALADYLRERVAGYKIPRVIEFIDEMPRTPTGKLLKRTLMG